jgi:hypothetical protein
VTWSNRAAASGAYENVLSHGINVPRPGRVGQAAILVVSRTGTAVSPGAIANAPYLVERACLLRQ